MIENYNSLNIDIRAIQSMTRDQVEHYQVVPFAIDHSCLSLYTSPHFDREEIPSLKLLFGRNIEVTTIKENLVQACIDQYYRSGSFSNLMVNDKGELDDLALTFENLIEEAISFESSDVHIEPYKNHARIRFRILGMLREHRSIDIKNFPLLINRIKVRAGLDISEKRLPQDGRVLLSWDGTDVDIRISIVPSLFGEKIVLRLLTKNENLLSLDSLGMHSHQLGKFKKGIEKKHGLILVCGPTGSGKTTSLYAALRHLNKVEKNIISIEDPVEYTIPGINQVQLNEKVGLSFPIALKSFLRQDPDIIMLGEIRDGETAEMAVRSSMTGHLVLSTLHTNTAWGAIARLTDMNIPAYLLATTICLSVSQRLVRILCDHCKEEVKFTPNGSIGRNSHLSLPQVHYQPVGCDHCVFTGYTGRRAIYEVISFDKKHLELVRRNVTESEAHKSLDDHITLADSALALFCAGKTSFDEVYPYLYGSK